MKRLSPFAVLLLAAVPGLASSTPHNSSSHNQFHFPLNANKAVATAKLTHDAQSKPGVRGKFGSNVPVQSKSASARMARHFTANPPTGKIGFVSATQIPAGGENGNWPASEGDFNGDSKPDAVMIVGNYVSNNWTYFISVVLSNGDGTFQAPVLTAVPGNDGCAGFVVGDVNGDKIEDILIIHSPNCNGYTTSNFDVMLGNGDGTFTQGNNYVLSPNSVSGGVLQDVNGDGKLDAVVVDRPNGQNSNVLTLLGNGDGTFSATPTSVALTGAAGQANLVDLNGDGLLDVAALDANSNELTIYLATSTSTYAAGAPYTTPYDLWNACSLATGDLNGDGKPEIVTSNCQNNNTDNLTVYVNHGDGSFRTGENYAAAQNTAVPAFPTNADVYPYAVTVADINGDGKADIISSNVYGGDVTILLGNGDGTVKVPSVGYATGGYPWTPAIVADFNGDGSQDILVPDDVFSLAFLRGYGDGSFRAALDYYSPIADDLSAYGYEVATGDFNGDGVPDFVLGNCCNSTVGITVFLSRPDGSMQPGINYGAGNLEYVAVADFNGDKKLDIAATNNSTGMVQIFTGNGDGTFAVGPTVATDVANYNSQGLVAGDFNKDGFPDLAVINYNDGNVGILLNDKTGNFQPVFPYTLTSSGSSKIVAGDLNGDGNLDLVVPMWSGSNVAILLGNGDGTFQGETDLAVPANPYDAVIADLNGDGKMDLAMTIDNYSGTGIAVALGNGDGTFQTPVQFASTLQATTTWNPYASYISVTDVDGDGNPDLVYTNSEYGTVGILFGQGNGSFYDPVEFPSGSYAYGLVVADVNGDGAPDVVTAARDFSGVTVLLNANGKGTMGDYAVNPSQTTATVTAGSTATFTLAVNPINHYNGTVTFSCGSLPSLTTCTFNPPTATLSGIVPATVQLTLTTTGTSAALQAPNRGTSILLASLSSMGLFGMVLAGSLKKRSRWTGIVLGMLVLTMMLSLVACGGSSSSTSSGNTPPPAPSTPAGNYQVTVTATGTAGTNNGNTAAHPVTLTLTVQ